MFYQYAIILTLYCAFVKQKFLPKENRAHIENMVQRYRRLSEGSLDSDNIAKYRAKLSEWKARKSENDSLFEKRDREITLQNITRTYIGNFGKA